MPALSHSCCRLARSLPLLTRGNGLGGRRWNGKSECNSSAHSSMEASWTSLVSQTARPRHVGRPLFSRQILREPAQRLFKALNVDIGAGLKRSKLLAVVEDPRTDGGERNIPQLSVSTRDLE